MQPTIFLKVLFQFYKFEQKGQSIIHKKMEVGK